MIEFMGSYQVYDCYETFLLYEEFETIPDNHLSFVVPEGEMLTCSMMRTFLKAAYLSKGIWNALEM